MLVFETRVYKLPREEGTHRISDGDTQQHDQMLDGLGRASGGPQFASHTVKDEIVRLRIVNLVASTLSSSVYRIVKKACNAYLHSGINAHEGHARP